MSPVVDVVDAMNVRCGDNFYIFGGYANKYESVIREIQVFETRSMRFSIRGVVARNKCNY
jgi:hypothetical protein